MDNKKIELYLSPKRIDDFIKYLKTKIIQRKLYEISNEFLKEVKRISINTTSRAVEVALNNSVGSYVSYDKSHTLDEIKNSIVVVIKPNEQLLTLRVDSTKATYVNFGTGVLGEEDPAEMSDVFDWAYNVNKTAHIEKFGVDGWYFKTDDDMLVFTQGQKPTNFIQIALVEVLGAIEYSLKEKDRDIRAESKRSRIM